MFIRKKIIFHKTFLWFPSGVSLRNIEKIIFKSKCELSDGYTPNKIFIIESLCVLHNAWKWWYGFEQSTSKLLATVMVNEWSPGKKLFYIN